MTPKRGDAVAPPPDKGEYDIRYATNEAAKGWEDLSKQEPGNTLWAWREMRSNAGCCCNPPTTRHFRLRHDLASGVHGGRTLPQYQIEVLSGGRVWYLLDEERMICWLKLAGRGHPKKTE